MPKSKSPSPQEIHNENRQRDETESAFLPPGLMNHGNTCFMNSVLQGLIATRLLTDLVLFQPISASATERSLTPLSSRRSPQLMNGHKLGGDDVKALEDKMPIGDAFTSVMREAWKAQTRQDRPTISPRALLTALGQKYDQYNDFAQQDAHEFLRILLDAMRMEEQDVAKVRQPPPPPKKKKKRKSPITHEIAGNEESMYSDEDKLTSFTDMIFGGKLTSILVCQKCKHVSQTFEDFNDLSLGIKTEDNTPRTRDRLKKFAKRFTPFPSTSLGMGTGMQRSLSVPREGEKQQCGHDVLSATESKRRRSLDSTGGQEGDIGDGNSSSREDNTMLDSDDSHVLIYVQDDRNIEAVEKYGREKRLKKERHSDDGWAKFGRRLNKSVVVLHKKRKNRSTDQSDKEILSGFESSPQHYSATSSDSTHDESNMTPNPSPNAPAGITYTTSAAMDSSPPSVEPLNSSYSRLSPHHFLASPRQGNSSQNHLPECSKSPKTTPAEAEYIREVLADVPLAAQTNPFAMSKQFPNGAQRGSSSQGTCLGVSQPSGIEECLRLFTSVEILGGDNMVGCRRCWKIAHGEVASPNDGGEEDANENADELEPESDEDRRIKEESSVILVPPSAQEPGLSDCSARVLSDANISDSGSITSNSSRDVVHISLPGSFPNGSHSSDSPSGCPVPLISTTDPEAPYELSDSRLSSSLRDEYVKESAGFASDPDPGAKPLTLPASCLRPVSADLLSAPPHDIRPSSPDTTTSDDDTSASRSVESLRPLRTDNTGNPMNIETVRASQLVKRKKSKSKPTMLRPAYKRFLIASPPPVLVIHLKRFQQVARSPFSFLHVPKKLEDMVTFPEYLDLSPYLAPGKVDCSRQGKEEGIEKKEGKKRDRERCMYRLYAVVVHIGTMLNGHYVAYTAVPSTAPFASAASPEGTGGERVASAGSRQWVYVSDTFVRLVPLEEVLRAKAYICMYEAC